MSSESHNCPFQSHDLFCFILFRSLDEIESVLEFAKLERDEIKPVTQTIYFSEHLENDAIKLVELDSTVLKALESGER